MRPYKTGTNWCIWRWTTTDSEYILRLHIIKTPWFAICLHWINKPDAEPYLHDHPVSFLSIILRGAYIEDRRLLPAPTKYGKVCRRYNFIHASPFDQHRIVWVAPRTLTLCFMGPKRREWGFHTPKGWVYWRDYYAHQRVAKLQASKQTFYDMIDTPIWRPGNNDGGIS